MIPRALKRNWKRYRRKTFVRKEWWGSSKNPEDGKTQKWFILIAIWMKSIESSAKSKKQKKQKMNIFSILIWIRLKKRKFHSSCFFLWSRSCNVSLASTKLNRECNVFCVSANTKSFMCFSMLMTYGKRFSLWYRFISSFKGFNQGGKAKKEFVNKWDSYFIWNLVALTKQKKIVTFRNRWIISENLWQI